MAEKCLMAASLAALVFHPSSTIRCFKSKPHKRSTTTTSSPQRPKPPSPSKPSHQLEDAVEEPPKSRKKIDFHAGPSFPKSSTSKTNKPNLPHPPLKTGMIFNALVEFVNGGPSISVVETIFRSGWAHDVSLRIEKVLKVSHSEHVIKRFEEYRELVKAKAGETNASWRMERVMVDGNELLQFRGAALTCSLGFNGTLSLCNKKCCGVCRLIGSDTFFGAGFVSFCDNSWEAHGKANSISDGVINGRSTRKAIIMCRVIAGRVARYRQDGAVDAEEGGFDSVIASKGTQSSGREELIVLNPRAILPCFVVLYTVS